MTIGMEEYYVPLLPPAANQYPALQVACQGRDCQIKPAVSFGVPNIDRFRGQAKPRPYSHNPWAIAKGAAH